jgi:hypothetical protein
MIAKSWVGAAPKRARPALGGVERRSCRFRERCRWPHRRFLRFSTERQDSMGARASVMAGRVRQMPASVVVRF